MSFRNIVSFFTLGVIFYGVLELKSFLNQNFVENDTALKKKVNHALNGFQEVRSKKPEKKNLPE